MCVRREVNTIANSGLGVEDEWVVREKNRLAE
jgi:hypothetical protein